jgi:hypothetical protein
MRQERSAVWAGALCLFVFLLSGMSRSAAASDGRLTFSKDVEPILRRNCVECHRPGKCAPFSLISYEDAARRARQMALVTEKRFMPPWSAEAGGVPFRDCRRLTNAQVNVLRHWAAEGAREGKTGRPPVAPLESDAWPDGVPDLVVRLQTPFQIAADGPDIYHRFVLPLNLPHDRWLRMVVFRPDAPRITRMAMLSLDATGLARKMAARSSGNGYPSMVGQILPSSDNFGEWAPGTPPSPLPPGIGILAKKGADLVALVRLHPNGKPEQAQFQVGLYFAKEPPRAVLTTLALGASNVYVRPGEKSHTVTDSFTLPVDVDAFSLLVHAHLLCRTVKATAVLPDGTRQSLLTILDWNPNWQRPYTFARPLKLPAGTRLSVEFRYDNATPPPAGSVFNAATMEEMAYMEIQTAPERMDDLLKLRQAILMKQQQSHRDGP